MAKLYIICGHGAGDPGAVGGGQTEAERVRALAAVIKQRGGSAVEVLDTSRDWYADGGINSLSIPKDSYLLELHRDSASECARGAHVIIHGNYAADAFDKALAANLAAIFPGRAQTIVGRTDLANANRALARGINYRLAEVGFITNPTDRQIFDNNMPQIADAILSAAGIKTVAQAGWKQNDKGWWYQEADGSWPKNAWREINGYWYYFGDEGYALTGWQKIKGEWYYLLPKAYNGIPECAMLTGWLQDKNKWYYLTDSGAMAKSCTMVIDGKTYAFNQSGAMIEGCVPVDKNGALVLN